MRFVPLGRLLQNFLQLGALITIKQFLLAHILLSCEDCLLGLTAAVPENLSEEITLLPLFIKWSLLLAPCSIPVRYNDTCTEHAQWRFTREWYCLASEGGRMQPSLSWLPRVSYWSLFPSISPSLSSPSQSTFSCSQWPAEDFVNIKPVWENNRGCILYIPLPQSKTLS